MNFSLLYNQRQKNMERFEKKIISDFLANIRLEIKPYTSFMGKANLGKENQMADKSAII